MSCKVHVDLCIQIIRSKYVWMVEFLFSKDLSKQHILYITERDMERNLFRRGKRDEIVMCTPNLFICYYIQYLCWYNANKKCQICQYLLSKFQFYNVIFRVLIAYRRNVTKMVDRPLSLKGKSSACFYFTPSIHKYNIKILRFEFFFIRNTKQTQKLINVRTYTPLTNTHTLPPNFVHTYKRF